MDVYGTLNQKEIKNINSIKKALIEVLNTKMKTKPYSFCNDDWLTNNYIDFLRNVKTFYN